MKQATLANLWADAAQDSKFLFDIKAQEVCTRLAAAVAASGKTKSELAQQLGWTPSRVSHVLTGQANLTLKTIFEITQALGLDFSMVLHDKTAQPASAWLVHGSSAPTQMLARAKRTTCRNARYAKSMALQG